ncbi:MAG: hypothetical protein QXP36_07905 [Conexivisphaerales archaeon]
MVEVSSMIFSVNYVIVGLLLVILAELLIGVFITARMSVWWIRRHIGKIVSDILTDLLNDEETMKQIQEVVKKLIPSFSKSMTTAQMRNAAITTIAQVVLSKILKVSGSEIPNMPNPPELKP